MAAPEPRRVRFEALFREHHPAVRAYARRRVPAEVVDDIVSETFLVVWRRLDDMPERPLPWLLTVARNVVGTERRGAARRQRLWLIAQMVGQLNLERPLHHPLRQSRHQTARADDLLLALRAREQLVDHLVRQQAADVIRHAVKDPRPGRRLA